MAPKPKLITRLQRRLRGFKSGTEKQSASQPPYLPSPRPHTLTPKPSRESLADNHEQSQSQSSSCPLFAKLPFDIRREILLIAFGGRTLHMDLVFDHPLIPLSSENQTRATFGEEYGSHAALNKTDHNASMPLHMYLDEPKVWRWGGSVCHRNMPQEPFALIAWSGWKGPWYDFCQLGYAPFCHMYEGQWPGKCTIGIMGFLLSCRQAYTEGIDILYGANRISMASEPLLLNLPKLILPQRLACIRTLELSIKAHIENPRPGESRADYSHLAPILDTVAAHCPGIQGVYLSLNCGTGGTPDRFPVLPLLRTADAFFWSMRSNSLQYMTVELPDTAYDALREAAVRPPPEQEVEGDQLPFIWRCLDKEDGKGNPEPEIQMRRAGNYPKPPFQLQTPENQGKYAHGAGYWIFEGIEYEPPHVRFMGCSGFTAL